MAAINEKRMNELKNIKFKQFICTRISATSVFTKTKETKYTKKKKITN